ncbi:hypothetical protein B0A48_18168 [Cryoendolithus antarcticus]|uniref:F-box domain-containing protein n=1 Tax=Cryoendolithus antarcticus TaxID=1507870 RepID=A0A1V8SA02_9PEZI|nr:hypothetical protein B0A48_18168 [Cryoendolithus antarcticus]
MAAAEVLALPELLRNVLRHLDVETLLLSQRVNTLFKSGIQRSKDLQEKLYFRLKSSTEFDAEVTLNPLLTEPHEVWTKIRRTLQWHFAFDSFRLPPIQAQKEYDFLRKTISAGKLRLERNSNMASHEGFDWEESTWIPPVGAAGYDVYGDYVTQQKVIDPV